MQELYNLGLFLSICIVLYILFGYFHYNQNQYALIEGMTDASGNSIAVASSNGIAGNAAAYAAALKAATIKSQDTFLISKYRADYEAAILNLDDLISNLMLQAALSVDQSNPTDAINKLAKMQEAKTALNSVMKFVDSN